MSRFAAFVKERRYLKNISPSTVSWYEHAFKWLPSEAPSPEELKQTVIRMREKGLKETGCNAAIRAINAYLHWNAAGSDPKCSPLCRHAEIEGTANYLAHFHGGVSPSARELETEDSAFPMSGGRYIPQ